MSHHIVQELVAKISEDKEWSKNFQAAINTAADRAREDVRGISKLDDFYNFLDGLLDWVPFERTGGREIYETLCLFYFIFGQKEVYQYQTPIDPKTAGKPLTWLSDWMVRYAQEMGKFMDTPESLTPETLVTFWKVPDYHMNDYLEPHGGWKTFNQFFARNVKPGYRPITDILDAKKIVSPADSTYGAKDEDKNCNGDKKWCEDVKWDVDDNSDIDIKGIKWSIKELLKDSKYRDKFAGGIFMHSFLGPKDYHRLHAPVGGKVLESKLIKGQVFLEVIVDGEGKLQPVRTICNNTGRDDPWDPVALDAPNTAGYQFCQMRGLVILHTDIGLVAVLPIGMCQISSVILTAEVGKTLVKGEEIAYFQFGGSDIVMVFQKDSKVTVTAEHGKHYNMGEVVAQAE